MWNWTSLKEDQVQKPRWLKNTNLPFATKKRRGCVVPAPWILLSHHTRHVHLTVGAPVQTALAFGMKKEEDCTDWADGLWITKNLKQEIVSAICNKKKKALCCPKVVKMLTVKFKQKRTTMKKVPTYLPIAGDCGSNPHKTLLQRWFNDASTGTEEFSKMTFHRSLSNKLC